MLGADVVVAERQRLAQRELEHLLRARRERDLAGRDLVTLADDAGDLRAHLLHGDVERLEHPRSETFLLAQQAEQDVLRADVVVLQRPRLVLREDDDLAGPFGESLEQPSTPLSACDPKLTTPASLGSKVYTIVPDGCVVNTRGRRRPVTGLAVPVPRYAPTRHDGQGSHHRRRRLHRQPPLRAAARRRLGGVGARRPLHGLARERRAPPRPAGLPPRRRQRAPVDGRERARLQVRRRLPPRRRGRRRASSSSSRSRRSSRTSRGTEIVLEHCHRFGKRVLVASTSEVYGDHREETPLEETARRIYGPTTQRRWAYADSKAMDEFLALAHFSEHGLDCTIARLFNTVGPRQSGQYGMVIPTLRAAGARRTSRWRSTATATRRAASATCRTRSGRSTA